MWIALAIVAFIAGQVYLFQCLRKLDGVLENQQWDEPQKEVLSIAFSDPTTADMVAKSLERFSFYHPEVDIMLLTGQKVLEAVNEGRASVGFLPAGNRTYTGLNSVMIKLNTAQVISDSGLQIAPLEECTQQEVVWKQSSSSSTAEAFVRYLQEHNEVDSRNTL